MPQYPNEAQAIENLQRYLRQLSYSDPSITPPPIDGILERDTTQALRDFQRTRGMPETGVADRDTWEQLYDAYRASLVQNAPPRAVSFFPIGESFAIFQESNAAFPTAVLQYMLRELGARYDDFEELSITGLYDPATARAVEVFQARNRLPVTGRVDLATWNAVTDQHNILLYGEG